MKMKKLSTHKKFLCAIFLMAMVSFVLGLINTIGGNFNQVVWVLCPFGIFVWGDAIVLGPFLAIASVLLWHKNRPNISGVFFSLYAGIRAFIEVLYNLNAQFTTTQRPWDPYWQDTRMTHFFGIIETNVLAQVVFTVVIMIAFFAFLYYVKNYLNEEWFAKKNENYIHTK